MGREGEWRGYVHVLRTPWKYRASTDGFGAEAWKLVYVSLQEHRGSVPHHLWEPLQSLLWNISRAEGRSWYRAVSAVTVSLD